jgi:hypothetical protein
VDSVAVADLAAGKGRVGDSPQVVVNHRNNLKGNPNSQLRKR